MNQDKAREFFTAFYEGNLEPGLRQSFETRLRNDSVLQADFSAFVATMEDLRVLGDEEIEVPTFLSDRISTRLEEEMARRKRATPVWAGWLRGTAWAGLGAIAIAGAVISLRSSGSTSNADTIAPMVDEQPTFALNGAGVVLNYHPSAPHTVVVSSAVSGREMERFTADTASPAHPFENKLPGTALFQLQVMGETTSYVLALPGSARAADMTAPNSPGSIRDFAVSLASRYRIPVLLQAGDTGKRLAWKLDGGDATHAAATALTGEPYAVDQRENGILHISDR